MHRISAHRRPEKIDIIMRYKSSDKCKCLKTKGFGTLIATLMLCLLPLKGMAQAGEDVVNTLVEMGYENVSCTEEADERIYVLQNSKYRAQGVGIAEAVDLIQKIGLPEDKSCRIIVLDNNVPQISLTYTHSAQGEAEKATLINSADESLVDEFLPEAANANADKTAGKSKSDRSGWKVGYDLGSSARKALKAKRNNSSLFKVDIVVYPEFMFQNFKLSRMYDIVLNVSPAIEVSLWRGSKVTAQVIFPIVNDYGPRYRQIRPGFVTLEQTVRLPYRTFLTGTVGFFSAFRWGGALAAKHVLKDDRFWFDAKVAYTGKGYFEDWAFYHGTKWTLTGQVGANFYWQKYNTQFNVRGERFLAEDYGMVAEVTRHFRYAAIGFYGMKTFGKDNAANNGFNGGFFFRMAMPPFKKYKRRGYIPRVMGGDFGIRYNAGNELFYGKRFRTNPGDNERTRNSFNPNYIETELFNY